MAITERVENAAKMTAQMIRESKLDPRMQEDLCEMLEEAKEATNGYTPEHKLQAVSENQFRMTRMLSFAIIQGAKPRVSTWREVIVECKREICICAAMISVTLILRPQLAAAVQSLFGK